MLISELIALLSKAKEEHGEIEVAFCRDEYDQRRKCQVTSLEPELFLTPVTNKRLAADYFYDKSTGKFLCSANSSIELDIGKKILALGYGDVEEWRIVDDYIETQEDSSEAEFRDRLNRSLDKLINRQKFTVPNTNIKSNKD